MGLDRVLRVLQNISYYHINIDKYRTQMEVTMEIPVPESRKKKRVELTLIISRARFLVRNRPPGFDYDIINIIIIIILWHYYARAQPLASHHLSVKS